MSFSSAYKFNSFTICSHALMKNLTLKRPVGECPLESLTYKAFRTVGLRNPVASQED